jgi:hypothetical protein
MEGRLAPALLLGARLRFRVTPVMGRASAVRSAAKIGKTGGAV